MNCPRCDIEMKLGIAIRPEMEWNALYLCQQPMINAETLELNGDRIWAGMDWSYNPIHPVKYLPMAKRVRSALDDLMTEYGVESE
jgi:hypothetical protein